MTVATVQHGFQPKITPEQYESAKTQYFENVPIEDIAKVIGCNAGLLRTRFHRDGLPAIRAGRSKTGRGERTKHKFAEISENIADVLLEKTPKSEEGLNLHADTAQKAAKIASLVHGWGEQTNIAVIVAGDISGDPEPDPIDVETVADGQQEEEKP